MKKIWRVSAILLILAMVLPLFACGGGHVELPTEEEETAETTPVTTKKKKFDLVEYRLEDIQDDIRILGERSHFVDGALTADWPCSGFEVKFETEGTDFAFGIDTNYQNFIKVIVDGEPIANRFALSTRTEKKVVVKAMEAGTHVIRVLKDGQIGTASGSYCNFTSVHFEGTLLRADNEKRDLYIEFIGDSIWCGGGALGNSANSSNYTNETSASAAVPYLTAEALDADYDVIARGSIGVYATMPATDGLNMTQLWPRLNGYRDEVPYKPTRTPDAVVICLGTNDSKDAAGDFVRDGKAFLRNIRATYGEDVPIIWTYGMFSRLHMYTEMEMVTQQLGGEANGIYLLQMKYGQNGSGSGADNRHPSADDHAKNAQILIPFLQQLLGTN